jgi:pimeloyl-ACP methyl ester carboxylesterase
MEIISDMKVRRHGGDGPLVIVLYGGPGAAGSAVELALGLSDGFAVIEPWQRGSGGREPLTVARHNANLHDVVLSICNGVPPALVGESWGAMLALAYAAGYARDAGPIVLVGCGTFDKESRALSLHDRIMKWHDMTDTY